MQGNIKGEEEKIIVESGREDENRESREEVRNEYTTGGNEVNNKNEGVGGRYRTHEGEIGSKNK